MSESPCEKHDLSPRGVHFQLLAVGTIVFVLSLFWLTSLPHTNTIEERLSVVAPRLVVGMQVHGCYVAFVALVFGHKLFARSD